MATITGQKLDQLTRLSLGSTGSLFYIVSSAGNSFAISERDLFNTLDKFHISGAYQPKLEDWRFVHKSGLEFVTGQKNFVNTISTPNLQNASLDPVIDLNNYYLTYGGEISVDWFNRVLKYNLDTTIDWANNLLISSTGPITLDWQKRTLSGSWNAESLQILGFNIVTGDNSNFITTGQTGQFASTTSLGLYVDRFTNQTISGLKTFSGISVTGKLNITNSPPNSGAVLTATGIDGGAVWQTGTRFLPHSYAYSTGAFTISQDNTALFAYFNGPRRANLYVSANMVSNGNAIRVFFNSIPTGAVTRQILIGTYTDPTSFGFSINVSFMYVLAPFEQYWFTSGGGDTLAGDQATIVGAEVRVW